MGAAADTQLSTLRDQPVSSTASDAARTTEGACVKGIPADAAVLERRQMADDSNRGLLASAEPDTAKTSFGGLDTSATLRWENHLLKKRLERMVQYTEQLRLDLYSARLGKDVIGRPEFSK